MSLTSMLADKNSAIRQVLDTELSDPRGFAAAFRSIRPSDHSGVKPRPPEGVRVQWGTIGAAIDHRLRYAFSDRGIPAATVAMGMDAVIDLCQTRGHQEAMLATVKAIRTELKRLVSEERSADRSKSVLLLPQVEERFARLCYVMSWFEEVLRTGRLWPGTAIFDLGAEVSMERLLAAVPDFAVSDMCAQVAVAEDGIRPLRANSRPSNVKFGPTFEGSAMVGGADADLIINGVLLEIKSTPSPSRLGREEHYQLIGYPLLDFQDQWKIHSVALYLSRFGFLKAWTLEEYLAMFGCTRSVRDLRGVLAGALTGMVNRPSAM